MSICESRRHHIGEESELARRPSSQLEPQHTPAPAEEPTSDILEALSAPQSTLQDTKSDSQHETVNDEFRMPKKASLIIVVLANILLQVRLYLSGFSPHHGIERHSSQMSFFIIVSSSHEYAEYLGGNSTFSGVVIGIPTLFSGLALLPLLRIDGGTLQRFQ